jgi:hypothetical protein
MQNELTSSAARLTLHHLSVAAVACNACFGELLISFAAQCLQSFLVLQ